MIHIGNVNAGDEVKLRFATAAVRNESGIKTVALYAINEETVQAFKEYVLKNTMEFDGYDGNCLNGHITADKAGILYRCLFWFVCLCTPEKHQMEDLLYMGGQPLDHRAGVKWQLCTECKRK